MPDAILFDPLGRSIALHDRTWFGHIIVRHAEMDSHRTLVERAIVDPLEIRFSAADAACRLYFGNGPREGTMVAVIAEIVAGFVKTAHFVKAAKGEIEWSRPTP